MAISGLLQLSLISDREWSCLFTKFDRFHGRVTERAQSMKDLLNEKAPILVLPCPLDRATSDSDWSEISLSSCADASTRSFPIFEHKMKKE